MVVPNRLIKIFNELKENNCRGFLVGGCVRDSMLGLEPKDIDIEVFGCNFNKLSTLLSKHGKIDLVGEEFGVIKLNNEFDFSIPRRDNRMGIKHTDFMIDFCPDMTFKEAAARRDFTINSMGFDPLNGIGLIDPYNGLRDLENKILRHTSDAFSEDPLRVLRGMQFITRFNLDAAGETLNICNEIFDKIMWEYLHVPFEERGIHTFENWLFKYISKERVSEEFSKMMLKGVNFRELFWYLQDTGWINFFPEMKALIRCPQDKEWHPEGDVDIHTMHVLNEAAALTKEVDEDTRLVVMFSALCHDFAKPQTTEKNIINGKERITSRGHEKAGGLIADSFLTRIGIKNSVKEKVIPIVENHLCFIHAENTDNLKRLVRRLAQRLHPATIEELSMLVKADCWGRPPLPKQLPKSFDSILEMAKDENITDEKPKPLIQGRNVLPFFDNKPGKHIGEVCKQAMEAQLDGEINNEEEAEKWLENYFKGNKLCS